MQASIILAILASLGYCQAWSYQAPLQAIAKIEGLNGVTGWFKFSQKSESEPTICEYDLKNLQNNNKLYHVHVKPIPVSYDLQSIKTNSSAVETMCLQLGGHFNPFNVTEHLPPKSAPFDRYELGDLSGKHGPMSVASDNEPGHYAGSFSDDKLPLFGQNTIIGRSIVIHKPENKDRWVCASILEVKQS